MSATAAPVVTGRLLEGRTAVVSGAGRARGIGKATARLFLAHGARVALLDLDGDEAAAAAAGLAAEAGHGARALGLPCDVTDAAACRTAVERVLGWEGGGGRLDVLVNNAGLTQKRPVGEIAPEDFTAITDVVLRGTLQLTQAALPAMRARRAGSIVNVSSMSARQGGGVFGGAHYCAAKAGVLGLTRSLARELGPDGIRANAVAPGLALTDFSRSGSTDEAKHALGAGWPLGRAGHPSEMAAAVLFLASDLASYVTGVTLDVNGGAYLH